MMNTVFIFQSHISEDVLVVLWLKRWTAKS